MHRRIYIRGRWITVEEAYAEEHGTEKLLQHLQPPPKPERGEALQLFTPETGRKPPTAEELYEAERRG
jgi:hypothetical protein